MKIKLLMTLVALTLVFFTQSVSAQDYYELSNIPSFVILDWQKGIIGGGAPRKREIKIAAKLGFQVVLDLRAANEKTIEKERRLVRKAGMKYFNIPVTAENLDKYLAKKVANIIQNPLNRPIIVHGYDKTAVAALYAIYINYYNDVAPDIALLEGMEKGLRKGAMKDKVVELLEK